MDICLLRIAIAAETDIVLVRSRTRRLAELIGFDAQDQTRITTAVSEIARNAYEYAGGGHIGFHLIGETADARVSSSWCATAGPALPIWPPCCRARTSRRPEWASGCWARDA